MSGTVATYQGFPARHVKFRRTRGWMIAGGAIEILKNRIAEAVFDRRFDQRPPKAR